MIPLLQPEGLFLMFRYLDTKFRVNIIVCTSGSLHIGLENQLLGHVPGDLAHFKKTTMGHSVIMGYNTAKSLPNGEPLVGRDNFVLVAPRKNEEGRRDTYTHMLDVYKFTSKGFQTDATLRNALRSAAIRIEKQGKPREIFIIGGAATYEEALKSGYVDRMYITMASASLPYGVGDVSFPDFLASPSEYGAWEQTDRTLINDIGDELYVFEKLANPTPLGLTQRIKRRIVKTLERLLS